MLYVHEGALYGANQGLCSGDVDSIINLLNSQPIKRIDLSSNNLTASDFKNIFSAVKNLAAITTMNLSDNQGIDVDSFELFTELNDLDVSRCDLTDKEVGRISAILGYSVKNSTAYGAYNFFVKGEEDSTHSSKLSITPSLK